MPTVLAQAAGIVGWLVVVAAAAWWILSWRLRQRLERLSRLIPQFGGSVGRRRWLVPTWSGSFQGLPISISVQAEWEYLPLSLYAAVDTGARWSLYVVRETWLTGFAKRLGLRKIVTRDAIFDRAFLLYSARPDEAARILREERIKQAVRDLFSWGCDTLIIDARRIVASKSGVTDEALDPLALTRVFTAMATLQAA